MMKNTGKKLVIAAVLLCYVIGGTAFVAFASSNYSIAAISIPAGGTMSWIPNNEPTTAMSDTLAATVTFDQNYSYGCHWENFSENRKNYFNRVGVASSITGYSNVCQVEGKYRLFVDNYTNIAMSVTSGTLTQ